ncbi:metallophosphoesterase family protein [Rhizobium sp. LjRoot254]|uniref:metallophosphoesterase family protein n=1 Tax=Rhizobium sp. LjRoot254 TaxID=3342297 RepID=UPI003ECC922E
MRIAVLSDIHANREAFTACLAAIEAARADRLVILGDIVGYGADPVWCLDKTRELLAAGAIVLRGNHDDAVATSTQSMNLNARLAIEWTRNQLSAEDRTFLGNLPMQIAEDDRLYVHASANAPETWHYMLGADDARGHFLYTDAAVSFCGHTHQPALFSASPAGKITAFTPGAAEPIPLALQRQWLAVVGSVGQPRDGNPMSAWALYDTETRTLRFQRIPYDIEAAAAKIHKAGLPEALAERLFAGY